ncbi:MAG: asparagine synthase (glutamine-hydrolyzing) [Gemmataceae bacterium]|nr:asparagine synthase (glutamine-hydrolyzing) [Gemmataceae bacterium]
MCGIAGILSPPSPKVAQTWLHSLARTLHHRGPDDLGVLTVTSSQIRSGRADIPVPDELRALFFHRRLSILDLSPTGWQPMSTPDGRFHIVFNGEIYNYIELREQLAGDGAVFRSRSDTEVLLHALARWGPAALPRLTGMFALALYDCVRRTVLLARDFFGIKPLYYVQRDAVFAFASEIKALLELPFVSRRADPQRLYDYLRLGRTDHGEGTLFTDVHQLPAAHWAEISLDNCEPIQPVRYWRLDADERLDLSFEKAADQLRSLFLDSVRLHLRSDVPVGTALSGGIDSSAIMAAMRAVAPNADLHAFSYIADDAALSEERWIDLGAERVSAAVHKTHARAQEMTHDLDRLIETQDEPFASTSIYAQYRVFGLAHSAGVKVMLDGQGADEMLAGYRPYVAARLASLVRQGEWREALCFLRQVRRLPGVGGLTRLVLQAASMLVPTGSKAWAQRTLERFWKPGWLNADWFLARQVMPPANPSARRDLLHHQLKRTIASTSLPMLLRYEDRNSMAFSVESRVPFLTPALVGFVLRLPEEYLLGRDGTSKNVFRRAMRGLVPDAILDRRDKIGFATPEKSWLCELRPWVERTLRSERARSIPVFRASLLEREWRDVETGRKAFDSRIWRWLNVIRWAERLDVSFED